MARPYPLRWRGRLNRKALVNCSIVHSRDDRRKVCVVERVRVRVVDGGTLVRYAGVYVCGIGVPRYRQAARYFYRALMPQVSIFIGYIR